MEAILSILECAMSETFEIACPSCDATRKAPSEFIGRKVKCSCGEQFTIRDPGELEFEQCASLADEPESFEPVTTTSSVAAAQRARATKGKMRALGMAAFVCSGVIGYAMFLRQDPTVSLDVPKVLDAGPIAEFLQGDEAHDWVEGWLAENTPTGEWEELRWMPATKVPGHGIDVCYIKIRTQNAFGALSVAEYSFERTKGDQWEKLTWPLSFRFSDMSHDELQRWSDIGDTLFPEKNDASEEIKERKKEIKEQDAHRQRNIEFLKSLE